MAPRARSGQDKIPKIATRMKSLRNDVGRYAWVVSFNTTAQLDSMAYMCHHLHKNERQPWITVDEVWCGDTERRIKIGYINVC